MSAVATPNADPLRTILCTSQRNPASAGAIRALDQRSVITRRALPLPHQASADRRSDEWPHVITRRYDVRPADVHRDRSAAEVDGLHHADRVHFYVQ